MKWKIDLNIINRWKEGKTGMPLVDSIMRELNTIGHISNRAR